MGCKKIKIKETGALPYHLTMQIRCYILLTGRLERQPKCNT